MRIDYDSAALKFKDLIKIMSRLRDKDNGCPWDKEQTSESIVVNLIEETYEVVEAIINKRYDELKEELGDLLMQIVFHSQIASEQDLFTIEDVISEIRDKLIRRHPHVFGDVKVESAEEVLVNWENIKSLKEKKNRASRLDGVPKAMPALARAYRIQEKVARFGFDWEKPDDVVDKLFEEISELKTAIKEKNREKIEEEMGDFLFTVVNYARHLGVEPELALSKSINKFVDRFKKMESAVANEGKNIGELSIEELDSYWEKVK